MDNPIFFKIGFLTLVIFDLCYLGFLSNKPQSDRSSNMIDVYNGLVQREMGVNPTSETNVLLFH